MFNNHLMGIPRTLPKSYSRPLWQVNLVNNDLCINRLNIMINRTFLNNLCFSYNNISTGNNIYLFDFHNQHLMNHILYFNIYAISFCPIDSKFNFNIYFDNYSANCFLNNSINLNLIRNGKILYRKPVSCFLKYFNSNYLLDDYYFPKVISYDNIIIKIYNYRTYLTSIFKEFICTELNNCILKIVSYEKTNMNIFPLKFGEKQYSCVINEYMPSSHQLFPILKKYNCSYSNSSNDSKKIFISGLPYNLNLLKKRFNNDDIPFQFIIERIEIENEKNDKNVIIIGNLLDDLEKKNYIFRVFFFFPNITLSCHFQPYHKSVLSYIYCINNANIQFTRILIENQIVHTFHDDIEIILINKETFLKLNLNINLDIKYKRKINNYKIYNLDIYYYLIIILFIILNFKKYNNIIY